MALVKYNNNSISAVTSTGLATASLVPIKTLTASSSATLSFVDGSNGVVLDSTYPIYKFEFIKIHPGTDDQTLNVNFRDGGTAYDATKTTTMFYARHNEADSNTLLTYSTGLDVAQGTGVQPLSPDVGSDNDQNTSGTLWLFNPSSTTFVKHFFGNSSVTTANNYMYNFYYAGYCNVTAAIDGVQFSFGSGNIDSGKIKLYGIKDS
jgi:hypothetical protein